jgi:GNAT superfamily N-acetyltransferase
VLSRDHVGQRVVVRRRLSNQFYSDVLGELSSFRDQDLVILTDQGEVIVPFAEIVAAKVVPPRPVKYSEIASLERTATANWPTVESERLGDWLLRAGAGQPSWAASALALGDPGMPLEVAVARVVDWYQSRGLIARFALPMPLAKGLDRLLARRGWAEYATTTTMTAPLERPPATDPQVALSAGTGQVASAYLRIGDDLVGEGRGVVVDAWLGLSLIRVEPEYHWEEHATRIVAKLIDWGFGLGATQVHAQVEDSDIPAMTLYMNLGFRRHHYVIHRQLSV